MDDVRYMRPDSEVTKRLGSHEVGELVTMGAYMMHLIRAEHGEDKARLVGSVGNAITTNVHDSIRKCVEMVGIGDDGLAYLAATVAANTALSVFAALDEMQFEIELDEFQNMGGGE